MAATVRAEAGWAILELDSDHLPMLSDPELLVKALQESALG